MVVMMVVMKVMVVMMVVMPVVRSATRSELLLTPGIAARFTAWGLACSDAQRWTMLSLT